MELIRDYLPFVSTNKGYCKNWSNYNSGPIFNFFGYDIVGLYISGQSLVIEFDKKLNPLGIGLPIESEMQSGFEIESFKVGELNHPLPIERVQVYEINDSVTIKSLKSDQFGNSNQKMTIKPLYDRGVRIDDTFYIVDDEHQYQRLYLPLRGLDLINGKTYVAALTPRSDLLKSDLGLAKATTLDSETNFSIQDIRTDIRTATVFPSRNNEICVRLFFENEPLSVLNFQRYTLLGLTESALDTDTSDSFLKYGTNEGEFILDLSQISLDEGVYSTTLIGFNAEHPEGVVLWHKSIVKSRLNITVVANE